MAGPTLTSPQGIQDSSGARAVAVLSPNTRARGTAGLLATVLDTVIVPGGTGTWIVPDQRVTVGGAQTISASASGVVAYPPPKPPGTMLVVQPDTRIRST
jgi:hypothetical protein